MTLDHDAFERGIVDLRHETEANVKNLRRNGGAALDERDVRLIALLEAERPRVARRARPRARHLAAERQRAAEAAGGCRRARGFTVALDPRSLGLADRRLYPHPARDGRARPRRPRSSRTIPEIVECHRITGEDCFIAKVFVAQRGGSGGRDRPADPLRAHQHLDHPVLSRAAPPAALCVSDGRSSGILYDTTLCKLKYSCLSESASSVVPRIEECTAAPASRIQRTHR